MFGGSGNNGSGRSSPASSGPSKRRADSPDDGAMMVSSSPSSLSSSGSEFNNQVTLLLQTQRDWINSSLPLEERWGRAITVIRYASSMVNGLLAASETVLMHQDTLASNTLWTGLQDLKAWVSFNIHRVVVPPNNARARTIAQFVQTNPFCVTMSNEACGVRGYLKHICSELRIDFFCVGGTYFEDGMMKDLLDAARKSRRALILFDRTNWFSHAAYHGRGVDFMHHLSAAIKSEQARRDAARLAFGPTRELNNGMQCETMASLLPNLWVVISSTGADVVAEVLKMANGCVYRWEQASVETAYDTVLLKLRTTLQLYGFEYPAIEHALSQSNYTAELRSIAQLLGKREIGSIVALLEMAIAIAYRRDSVRPTHGDDLMGMLPMLVDVQQAINQMSGYSVGGVAAVFSASAEPTIATAAAAAINQQRRIS